MRQRGEDDASGSLAEEQGDSAEKRGYRTQRKKEGQAPAPRVAAPSPWLPSLLVVPLDQECRRVPEDESREEMIVDSQTQLSPSHCTHAHAHTRKNIHTYAHTHGLLERTTHKY